MSNKSDICCYLACLLCFTHHMKLFIFRWCNTVYFLPGQITWCKQGKPQPRIVESPIEVVLGCQLESFSDESILRITSTYNYVLYKITHWSIGSVFSFE